LSIFLLPPLDIIIPLDYGRFKISHECLHFTLIKHIRLVQEAEKEKTKSSIKVAETSCQPHFKALDYKAWLAPAMDPKFNVPMKMELTQHSIRFDVCLDDELNEVRCDQYGNRKVDVYSSMYASSSL
jgi:hypothetical protein